MSENTFILYFGIEIALGCQFTLEWVHPLAERLVKNAADCKDIQRVVIDTLEVGVEYFGRPVLPIFLNGFNEKLTHIFSGSLCGHELSVDQDVFVVHLVYILRTEVAKHPPALLERHQIL